MKFFTKYSLFANTFSIIAVTMFTLYISYEALSTGGNPNDFSPSKSVEMAADNFNYNEYNPEGNITTSLQAKKLYQYVNQDVLMIDLTQKSYDDDGFQSWQVDSHKGFSQKVSDNIHLYDGMNSIMFTKKPENQDSSGGDAKLTPKEIHMKSSEMYYNQNSGIFYNSKFVKIYDPKNGNNTTGMGINGSSKTKIINMNQDIRSYYAEG